MRPGGGGGELGFLSQKPVCNRKEIPLAVLQWRIGIQRSASEIQLLEVHSSVLPADPACPLSAGGLYSVGNYLNVWTGGDPILLFAAPLLFPLTSLPRALEAIRPGKRDLGACTAGLARCCHHHGFLQAQAELF